MSSSSAGGTDLTITNLSLSDPRCNSVVCLAFKAAEDASQGEIPFASQFVYGHFTVYYYFSCIALFSILHLHRRLSAGYMEYQEPKTTVFQKIKALWRCVMYRKLGIGMSLGHTIMVGFAVLFTTILAFVQKPYFRPRLAYGSPPLGVRTGVIALALTPVIVALSGKSNLITLVTGISHERLNILHRYLGYICLGLGIVHTVAFLYAMYGDSNYWPLLEMIGSTEYTGVVVMFLLLFLTIFSIPWFRQRFYEIFASSHIAVYLLYLGFMFWHTANRIDTWVYLYATVAISLLSNLSRLLKFKTPRWGGSTATIQDIDGEMLRITIPAFNGMTWKPGQHVYLRFPSLSTLENHPFTIASLCEETYVTDKNGTSTRTPLLFLIKTRTGLTKRLMKFTQQRATLRVFIDGPYGDNHLNLSSGYEQVILVAGGSGISAVLPLFSMLCKKVSRKDSILRSVKLIWVIKNRLAQAWVQEEIKTALAMTRPGTVEIHLFITGEKDRAGQIAFSFEAGDIELEDDIGKGRKISEEVDLEEQRLIPEPTGFFDGQEDDSDGFLSLHDLEMEMGTGRGDETSRQEVDGAGNEDEKLVASHQMDRHHPNQYLDCDYGIEACISHGRPCFQDVLPRFLLEGGRVCIVGCGPQEMDIDLSNAVAACQTRVLRGRPPNMYSSTFTVVSTALLAAGALSHSPNTYHFNPLEHLAGVTPPFNPLDPPLDPSPPQGCNVTRAAYLVRHSSIYSNDFDYESYIEPFVQKLSNTTVDWSKVPILSFLATWRVPFTDSEQEMLTRSGKLEATRLGVDIAQRYQGLRTPRRIWTSTAERTVKSAKALAGGLADDKEVEVVEIYEGEEDGANSLTPYESCPGYSSSTGGDQSSEFLKVYTAPPAARFNSAAPAFNFTAEDIYAMSLLCGYETVIRGSSPFCDLKVLSPNEWLGFEYTNDIMYHYNTGYGSPVSGAIGFPWANATFHTLMSAHNNISNATTDQDLYISFTHRELPPTVLVALGLFNNSAFSNTNNVNSTMPSDRINHRRAWKSSHIVPFLTNVAVEKMECESFAFEKGTFYRVLVNGSPQSLDGCSDGPGESCEESELVGWLEGRGEVVGGFGSVCGVEYGNGTDVLGIYDM
ncbi:hypothetical protein IFR05_003807 [Cadophora sp. M221]|nr:hypothetical protein IFR05_003807 [Cadophora sp. M221]